MDASGNVYVAGSSADTWGSPVSAYTGKADAFVATLGDPEIDVQGKGQSIADGDSTPTPADGTDFGYVFADSGTVEHTFTIRNIGSADLNLTGSPIVEITGTHAGDFVIAQPNSSVAPGGSTTFTVQFDPSAIGLRIATVYIDNNDGNEDPCSFAIQGAGALMVYLPLVQSQYP